MAVPVREDETDRPARFGRVYFFRWSNRCATASQFTMFQNESTNFAPVVPVVNVVRMLPHVKDHKDIETGNYVGVVFFDLEDERPPGFPAECQGGPSGSLRAHRCLGNSFLNRSNFENSPLIALASSPFGTPPPPFPAGARFSQNRLWSLKPPI